MKPDFSIQGKVAIVTGASKGIGYGLAKALAAAGAKVAVAARSRLSLDTLVEEITAEGGEARGTNWMFETYLVFAQCLKRLRRISAGSISSSTMPDWVKEWPRWT